MKYKKEDLINEIVDRRINKMESTKTILKWLMTDVGYGQTYSYELLKEARKTIVELYQSQNESSLEEAIGQLENMAEEAKSQRNYKLAFEVRKELSKIMGHYVERQDITSGGKAIQEIKLIHITNGNFGNQND